MTAGHHEPNFSSDCLFITSSKSGSIQFSVYPYLGVGYLSAYLKNRNLKCDLYDVDLKGMNLLRILDYIAANPPRMLGYSIMSISLPFFYALTKAVVQRFPNLMIVAGGPHVTADPGIIRDMGIHFGFAGQCEISFPEFVDRVKQLRSDFDDIPGIIIPERNIVVPPRKYDITKTTVLPDYSLYRVESYQNVFYGHPWFTMITTDGCPYNCKFCKNPGKNSYREYPLEYIFNQIRTLVVEKKCQWISFVDDSFTFNRARVIEICKYIIREGLQFKWTCCTRADAIDEELLHIMKAAGLHFVIIGVEAGNEEIRRNIDKHISTDLYAEILQMISKEGVRCLCSYVLGNPGETYSQIHETVRLSRKLKADYAQFYNMTALPQSPIFTYGINEGIFSEKAWSDYMKGSGGLPYYIPKGLQLHRLKQIKTTAFLRYYLRPRQLSDIAFRIIKLFYCLTIRNRRVRS